MKIKVLLLPAAFTVALLFNGCAVFNSGGKVGSIFFSIEDDKQLGKQVSQEINSNSTEYPVLPPSQYPAAYKYLNDMKEAILKSGDVAYRDEFVWELRIINQDVLNAFATPGGYIYVYTGLIKYLNEPDDLAGVMGHEIAHADRRHSIKQLEKIYGIQILLDIALGTNSSQLGEIAKQLATAGSALKFSRDHESDADDYSVKYLASTNYACNGAASFFQKMIENKQTSGVPEFLSTHPSPGNRVEDINEEAEDLHCSTRPINESGMTYEEFKKSLP